MISIPDFMRGQTGSLHIDEGNQTILALTRKPFFSLSYENLSEPIEFEIVFILFQEVTRGDYSAHDMRKPYLQKIHSLAV